MVLGRRPFELQALLVLSVLRGEGLWILGRVDAAGVAGHGDSSSWMKGLHALPLGHAATP